MAEHIGIVVNKESNKYVLVVTDRIGACGCKKLHIGMLVIFFLMSVMPGWLWAETVNYDLTITQEKITIAGATVEGMTINGGKPIKGGI